MTSATESTATATLSGRELALKRRQAMALHGKAGVAKAMSVRRDSAQPAAKPATIERSSPNAPISSVAPAAKASRQRREALSQLGKAALQGAAGAVARPAAPAAASPTMGTAGTARTTPATYSPMLASEARPSRNDQHTPAVSTPSPAIAPAASRVLAASSMAAQPSGAPPAGSSGRQVAMQRRQQQSLTGRGASKTTAAQPSGPRRVRSKDVQPAPVTDAGPALPGRSVKGAGAERNRKVTGNEAGSSRVITGTEHIGAGQFEAPFKARPAAAPASAPARTAAAQNTSNDQVKTVTGTQVGRSARVTGNEAGADRAVSGTRYARPAPAEGAPVKVSVTHTAQGKPVTGTAIGHIPKLTGDEAGACRGITGTQYLSAEHFEKVCGTAAPDTPRKVSVMSSRGSQPVSGNAVGRAPRVTGDEPGACRQITGSQYFNPGDFAELCNAQGPHKVGVMQTQAGQAVTGTEVGPGPRLTGDEEGRCKPVTGADYVSAGQMQAVCGDVAPVVPVAPVSKVTGDRSWRGQPITGSHVGRSPRVTGDEPGGCAPISGTPYIGRGQYNSFCEATAIDAQEARIPTGAMIPATAVTGDRPGAGGSVMTGDERGACEAISGTPYVGMDNGAAQCVGSGRFVSRGRTWEAPARPPAPADFSIHSPARQASEARSDAITGTACSSERITGPINKAGGLITGTPEFRHHDVVAGRKAVQAAAPAPAPRLTGEGSQAGSRVTGDAWHAQSRVTGTEGASSLARNPSQRGQPRGGGASARNFREIERPAVPESRITGSSGNTGKGALITLSGGARG